MASVTNKPDQRVSISKKQSRDWYIANANYWIARAMSLNDKTFTDECINAANGIITDSVFEYVLNPLVMDEDKLKKLPGKIRNIDFLTPIKEKNIGEYIQLPYQFHVITNSPEIAEAKDSQVKQIKFSKLQAVMAEAIQTGQLNEKRIAEIEKESIEEYLNWVDEKALKGKKTINYVNSLNNFDVERIQRFYFWWATEEFYTHKRIEGNNVIDETISPIEGYPIPNNKQFVEDYPGFVTIRKVNIYDIRNKYGKYLTKNDLDYLEELERSYKNDVTIPYAKYVSIYETNNFPDVNNTISRSRNDIISVPTDGFIKEYCICFTTPVKRNILHYIDSIGTEATKVVDEDYELNVEAGEIYLEEKWIDEAWWQVRIGEEADGIYTKPIPYEVQRYGIDGAVKIPYGGKKGLLRHNFLYPIPKRIIGSLALYQIINLTIERNMAKFKGSVEVIPQSMLNGKSAEDTKAKYFYLKADNQLIYDDTKVDITTATQGYRIVGNDALANFLKVLIDLRETIKQEAWDMSNMNSNRYGQASASETVRNNVSNIQLARLGSVLMIQMFNKALERDHAATLEYAKIAFAEGRSGSYTDTSGKIEVLHLGMGELLEEEFGVFVIDNVLEDQKLKAYQDLAFNASQNGDIELATEAINSDSSAGLRSYIKKFSQAKKEFEVMMKDKETENIRMQIEANKADKEAERAAKLNEIVTKETMTTEREIALKEMDSNSKSNVNDNKNKTVIDKSILDNTTKVQVAKMKPKPNSK